MRSACAAVIVLGLCLGPAAGAEIYRWTDEGGRVHFTQDLEDVPSEQRDGALDRSSGADAGPGAFQTYEAIDPPLAERQRRASAAPGAAPRTWRVPVQRAGTAMLVQARINDDLDVPFLIDTGASDVMLPQWAAHELGIEPGPDARTRLYVTANGVVEQPLLTLESVDLGGARVEGVRASVSPNMRVGLLGLSYFNHFTVNVNSADGVVTLTRNDLEATGAIRGGRSRAQWQSEFAGLRARITAVRAELEEASTRQPHLVHSLEAYMVDLEAQFAQLETEADRHRVPMAWRD